MKLFPRYRRPGLGTILGTMQAKRHISRHYKLAYWQHPIQTPVNNAKRRVLRKAGYYSDPMKFLRWMLRLGL